MNSNKPNPNQKQHPAQPAVSAELRHMINGLERHKQVRLEEILIQNPLAHIMLEEILRTYDDIEKLALRYHQMQAEVRKKFAEAYE